MREFPDDAPALTGCGATASRRTATRPTARSASASGASTRSSRGPSWSCDSLRPPPAPDGRDDLPQVVHVAAPVVLRDVPDDEHSLRHLRQAARARAWRHLQDRVAHVQPDPQRAHGRRRRAAVRRRRGRRDFGRRQAAQQASNKRAAARLRERSRATVRRRRRARRARQGDRPAVAARPWRFKRQVIEWVRPTSIVFTDEWPAYRA